MIGLAVAADPFLPYILLWVGEVKAALYLRESDTMSTTVLLVLGVVGVGDVEDDLVFFRSHPQMDETGQGRADPMFEGILDQRDKEHGCHLLLGVLDSELGVNLHRLRESDAHQLDIVLHKLHLVSNRNGGLLVVIEDMTQHLRQLLYRLLRLGGVKGCQGIDVVEGVQQEVRTDLPAQRVQFRLHPCRYLIPSDTLRPIPLERKFNEGSYRGGYHQVEDVTQDKAKGVQRGGIMLSWVENLVGIVHPEMQSDTQRDNHHEVDDEIVTVTTRHKIMRCQPQIVHVEHKHESDGHGAHGKELYRGDPMSLVHENHG